MARTAALTSIIVLVSVVGVLAARTAAQKADFAPALAAEVTAGSSGLIAPENVIVAGVAGDVFADFLDATAGSSGAQAPSEAAAPAVAETQTAPETVAPQTVAAPAAAVAPARTAAPQPVRTPAPAVAPAPAPAAPAPTTCPASWFCYPRLSISGPIVPYTDCSGSTDVGTAIRSYNCLSDHYLMAHAYTQFGLVRQWVAGDVVFAWGQRFTVSGAITQQSCGAPSFPLATLSMQTSLTSSACGPVLVVQAR